MDPIEYVYNDTEQIPTTNLKYDDNTSVLRNDIFRIYTIGKSGKKIYLYKPSIDKWVRVSFKKEGEYDKEEERSTFKWDYLLTEPRLRHAWIDNFVKNSDEPQFVSYLNSDGAEFVQVKNQQVPCYGICKHSGVRGLSKFYCININHWTVSLKEDWYNRFYIEKIYKI